MFQKIKTLLLVGFFRKSCHLWENVEKYGKVGQITYDNKIRRMSLAYWIRKAICSLRVFNTYCFSLQQWLQERASALRHMYVACLVNELGAQGLDA
jgi:hypothetical protein